MNSGFDVIINKMKAKNDIRKKRWLRLLQVAAAMATALAIWIELRSILNEVGRGPCYLTEEDFLMPSQSMKRMLAGR